MPSLVSQVIGVVAILLGVAWLVRPMRMIELQYRVLYFWVDDPDLSHANETAGRAGGALLAALGAALVVGVLP